MRTKKPLFQWDINQKFINCTGKYIDFIFDNDSKPYRVEIEDGTCLIPDEFLQTDGKKTVYECLSDGTLTENKLTVHGRPKPPNYVYTTTEKLTFDGLVQKVDDTVNDIINRANSGEFNGTSVTHVWEGTTLIITSASGTSSVDLKGEKGDTPKKGVDYYTENEIEGIIENITSGSIGKFKQTVEDETSNFNINSDNKLSAFNKNASDKTIELNNNANSKLEEYNINSENKLNSYNSNAANKIDEYNNNATDTITEFNNNALSKQNTFNENVSNIVNEFNTSTDTKISEYNSNAESRVAEYNQNDTNKTAEYNSNAKIKFDEYNTNADNRVAEFDSHTGQIQTDINELKNDLINVNNTKADKSDLDRTNDYLDALFKLNRGQTWDTQEAESNAYSVDVPSGSHYAAIDKVGGKSIVWNQCWGKNVEAENGITYTKENGVYHVVKSTTANNGLMSTHTIEPNEHKYYISFSAKSNNENVALCLSLGNNLTLSLTNTMQKVSGIITPSIPHARSFIYYYSPSGVECEYDCTEPVVVDLTQMFGAGNEPTIEEFEAMFPNDYYPYNEGEIISSQTDRVDVEMADGTVTQQITTGFPVLNSAGSVYDYIDLNEGKLHQKVGKVDLGTLPWAYDGEPSNRFRCNEFAANYNAKMVGTWVIPNLLSDMYIAQTTGNIPSSDMCIGVYDAGGWLLVRNSNYTDTTTFKAAMNGVMLYYELAEEIITDITIPTELSDWLTVEAGGSITFHNADEGKRLLIPNKLSFIRKLDEVTV